MEIFGVGPLEFLLILVLALVIMGPQDMVNTARKIGQWIYGLVRSPTWRAILTTTQDLRDLPQKIVRDAGVEEAMQEVSSTLNEAKAQMSEATMEISSEMQAATHDVADEMQISANSIRSDDATPTAPVSSGIYPFSSFTSGNTSASPEQASLNTSDSTPVIRGVYPLQSPQNSYTLEWDHFSRVLATGPISAANLDGIVLLPGPPPVALAEPELIAGALGLVAAYTAAKANPADLEVPFVFADPTEYERSVPPAKIAPQEISTDAAAVEPGGETPAGPSDLMTGEPAEGSQPLPTAEEIEAGLTAAMEQRMREMDKAFARLDAQTAQTVPPTNPETPETGSSPD